MITNRQIEFKKHFEQQKCEVHNQSAVLVISNEGTYIRMEHVCCDEFQDTLTEMVTNQIADETVDDLL